MGVSLNRLCALPTKGHNDLQVHPKSLMLAPIESTYFVFVLIVTLVLSCRVSEIQRFCRPYAEIQFDTAPLPAKISLCSLPLEFGVDL